MKKHLAFIAALLFAPQSTYTLSDEKVLEATGHELGRQGAYLPVLPCVSSNLNNACICLKDPNLTEKMLGLNVADSSLNTVATIVNIYNAPKKTHKDAEDPVVKQVVADMHFDNCSTNAISHLLPICLLTKGIKDLQTKKTKTAKSKDSIIAEQAKKACKVAALGTSFLAAFHQGHIWKKAKDSKRKLTLKQQEQVRRIYNTLYKDSLKEMICPSGLLPKIELAATAAISLAKVYYDTNKISMPQHLLPLIARVSGGIMGHLRYLNSKEAPLESLDSDE